MMMVVAVVTNCVTDGVSGGVGDMKMIGMLVVHNFRQYINCIYQYITSMSVDI